MGDLDGDLVGRTVELSIGVFAGPQIGLSVGHCQRHVRSAARRAVVAHCYCQATSAAVRREPGRGVVVRVAVEETLPRPQSRGSRGCPGAGSPAAGGTRRSRTRQAAANVDKVCLALHKE